ncbi:MAG: hypothetical protein ACKO25_01650 [Cyanobium sp.]
MSPLRLPRPVAGRWLRPLALAGALASVNLIVAAAAVRAEGEAPQTEGSERITLPLECRIAQGPWQPCRMRVEQVGTHWLLLIGEQQVEFRHDGRGVVQLRQQGAWRPVSSRWEANSSLCWDGYCARGDIPLD